MFLKITHEIQLNFDKIYYLRYLLSQCFTKLKYKYSAFYLRLIEQDKPYIKVVIFHIHK